MTEKACHGRSQQFPDVGYFGTLFDLHLLYNIYNLILLYTLKPVFSQTCSTRRRLENQRRQLRSSDPNSIKAMCF